MLCPGKWKQRDKGNWKVEQETATLSCASDLIGQKAHRNLVDFDNHLDDISKVPTERSSELKYVGSSLPKKKSKNGIK